MRARLVLMLVDMLVLVLIMVKIYTCCIYKVEERLGRRGVAGGGGAGDDDADAAGR